MPTCTFIGNADYSPELYDRIAWTIRKIIRRNERIIFLAEDEEPFEALCADRVRIEKKRSPSKDIALYMIACHNQDPIDRAVFSMFYDKIICIMNHLDARAAEQAAVEWRIVRSDVIIVCMEDGGVPVGLSEVREKKQIVNLAEEGKRPDRKRAVLSLKKMETTEGNREDCDVQEPGIGRRCCTIACVRKCWVEQSPVHYELLVRTLEFLIRHRGVSAFWIEQIGSHSPAVEALRQIKAVYQDVELTLILHDAVSVHKYESVYAEVYDRIICAESTGKVLRSKVLGAYKWMIDRSDFLLCSMETDTPLDMSLLRYAGRKSRVQTIDMATVEQIR